MRYFVNRLADFVAGNRVRVDQVAWKGRILSLCEQITQRMPPTFDNCDGGLYVGAAGIAYMFYYLANSEPFQDKKHDFLTRGRNYSDVALSYVMSKHTRDPPAAFLLGNAGAYAVGSLICHDAGESKTSEDLNNKYLALSAVVQPINYLSNGSDELFVGRAGFLCGALLLNSKFGQVISSDTIQKVCQAVIHSGRQYSQRHKSPCPLMYAYYNTEYLGAAHGLSAILQMLLCFPDFLKSDPSAEADVKTSVDFMLSLMKANGNIAPAMDEIGGNYVRPESEELVHWCHGGPGIVYLFARAFLYWKEDKYLQACLKCGELTWQCGLLKKGPGICHGVAGSGYVFLLLYRLTSDEKHLHRASKFAEFLLSEDFQKGARQPDSPYSLYEGWAGTICFLADLMQPHRAEFPLFNVFY